MTSSNLITLANRITTRRTKKTETPYPVGLQVKTALIQRHPGHSDQKVHAGRARGSGDITGGPVPPAQRVWQGDAHARSAERPSKLQTGEIGERLAMHVLAERHGQPFNTLNEGLNNAPIDVAGDHRAVEVKTGLASNGKSAQQWRATIGQPGKVETELLKQMTSGQKKVHNTRKAKAILDRKNKMLKELSEAAGAPVKGQTAGVILSPDGKRGDVFLMEGFHLRQSWAAAATEENYVGTYEVN